MTEQLMGQRIHINGIVQGVGFRPFVYNLALKNSLTGWVRNTSNGVEIEVNGKTQAVENFIQHLRNNPPPLARIDQWSSQACAINSYSTFEIIPSQAIEGEFIPVSPDVSICPDCQRELFDQNNRRYRYPFINCTNCGPRFTIIKDIPYDRLKTTMESFQMCSDCEAEYNDPTNRRFHAQPIACPVCGPQIIFKSGDRVLDSGEGALKIAREWLRKGKIIAVKGLGGYHLACDAASYTAVKELRSRKKRSDKPFALMAYDLTSVERHCQVTPVERDLLLSHHRPVVLLERRPNSNVVPEVTPAQKTLGFMLAYTPLHLLLLEPSNDFPDVLVMTSGNLSEEPISYEDMDAFQRLSPLVDGFLTHNRPIHTRTDDSVVRVINEHPYPIRRSRGYAPDPILLPFSVPPVLAAGGELKNTFCLTNQKYAFISHHIGDLENYETFKSYEEGIDHFERLFRVHPVVIACDLHPDYLSTRYALQRAEEQSIPLIKIQHHHAHLASCLVDNGWSSQNPVIGICFDGTGLGTDGTIWGGEVLYGNYIGYERLYHLINVPLPGGDMAIRKTSRMALTHLSQFNLEWDIDLPPVAALCAEERTALLTQLNHHLNTPLTSSIGRLFDAVSAFIGVCQTATYEGQAAIELEAVTDPSETGYYEFNIEDGVFSPEPLWVSLLKDYRAGIPKSVLASRFHNSIVELISSLCRIIYLKTGCKVVALSGGVWQNKYLLTHTLDRLAKDGFQVLWHHQVPANDGGISIGQALIAAHQAACMPLENSKIGKDQVNVLGSPR